MMWHADVKGNKTGLNMTHYSTQEITMNEKAITWTPSHVMTES